MQEISASIMNQKITRFDIHISPNLAKKFEANLECRAKVKTPKNKEDNSILLDIELNIRTKDENLIVKLGSDTIFELDQLPDDYEVIAEQKLVPMARGALLDSLDDMLVIMGYSKMELAKKLS